MAGSSAVLPFILLRMRIGTVQSQSPIVSCRLHRSIILLESICLVPLLVTAKRAAVAMLSHDELWSQTTLEIYDLEIEEEKNK